MLIHKLWKVYLYLTMWLKMRYIHVDSIVVLESCSVELVIGMHFLNALNCFLNDIIFFTAFGDCVESNLIYDVVNSSQKLSCKSKLPDYSQ